MISGHSSQPPKSAMKSRKRIKSTQLVKSNQLVESEDDEDTIVQVCRLAHFFMLSICFSRFCVECRRPSFPSPPPFS
jgi:hypothetical protein